MFDPKSLLDQFLGGPTGRSVRTAGRSMKGRLDQFSGSGGFATGAAAGGLLGLLLGGKGGRKLAGGALGYGGADAQPAADGSPFQLVLIRAMVGAAKADGHVDAAEQQRLFSQVETLGLDSEAKAYVFDLLSQPVDLNSITRAVSTPEQGAEVYLASRLAINPDVPAERVYLDALATRLKLPAALRAQLDAQAG